MNTQDILKKHFSSLGKKGGKKRWENVSAEERREIALKMVAARKKKGVDKPLATT
jgi:uncharacterized protein HemY